MYNLRFYYLFFYLLFLVNIQANAQADNQRQNQQHFPISLSVFNHTWAFPLSNVLRIAPIYPGISIGSEYHYRDGKKIALYQTFELGGFYNQSSGSAFYLNTNFGIRGQTKFGLMADFSFGLGYFHGFYPSTTYHLSQAGLYEKTKNNGIGASSANFSFTLGYQLKKTNKKITPFIGYQWMASTTYWSLITIRPNGLLKTGIRFNLK